MLNFQFYGDRILRVYFHVCMPFFGHDNMYIFVHHIYYPALGVRRRMPHNVVRNFLKLHMNSRIEKTTTLFWKKKIFKREQACSRASRHYFCCCLVVSIFKKKFFWPLEGHKYFWPWEGHKYFWPWEGHKYFWPWWEGHKYFWAWEGHKYFCHGRAINIFGHERAINIFVGATWTSGNLGFG